MLRRLCVALTLGILMLAALAQGAAADPSEAKNSLTFPAACDGQTVQVVVNGNGDFTPGHVVGSTAVFVLQSFNFTFEVTPTGGETMSETNIRSKGNVHGDLVTCSFDVTQTFPEGTFHLFGSATGFFTPAS
jgi:ABC-type glycerol-3-phosphate transport system substrate-binding protein